MDMMNREQNTDSLSQISESGSFFRSICITLIAVCSFVWYSPAVYATVEGLGDGYGYVPTGLEAVSPLVAEMKDIRDRLLRMREGLEVTPHAQVKTQSALRANLAQFMELDQQYRLERQAQISRLSLDQEEMRTRIEQSVLTYEEKSDRLIGDLKALISADFDPERVSSQVEGLIEQLSDPFEAPYQSYSNDLDFILPAPRDVFTTQAQIEALLGVSGEPGLSDAEYLETDDATASSAAIAQLAFDLNYNPIAIYNWVHDNMRWLPQYGLMQSADYSLQTGQGNAFDIASVLIAILREAGYPARYNYGTVGVRNDDLRNWVGDVINVDAATNIMSQGGIPQRQLSPGYSPQFVQFEHVWVQTKINGEWVDMEPSLKSYLFSEGVDLETAVPFDAEGLLTDLENSGTSNEIEGWVQGIDVSLVETELAAFETELETYLTTNMPNATLGDVLGLQTIIPSTALVAEDVQTPYLETLAAQPLRHLPDHLKYRFKLQIGSTSGGSLRIPVAWSSSIAELNQTTASLLGKSLAISFEPATPADEALLESYLPDVIEGIDDLPDSLPAGDVNMIGSITADGEVIASTGSYSLGSFLMTRLGFIGTDQDWRFTENNLIVGQYQAVGIDMQGISPQQLETLQSRLEGTQTALEAEEYDDLTKNDLVGDLLQTGIQSYLGMTYAIDKLAAQASDIIYLRRPSYGTFGTNMEVVYSFGVPSTVFSSGVVMDVDRLTGNSEHQGNCYEDWVAFNRSSGMRNSALEHQIPEQLFFTEGDSAEVISTAKALSLAAAEGQKIFTITSENSDQLDNVSIEAGARAEIISGLALGMEVTVHESPVVLDGWIGSGYSILDREYGVGAYKISGGLSGSWTNPNAELYGEQAKALNWIALVGGVFAAAISLPLSAAVLTIIGTIGLILEVYSRCPGGGGEHAIIGAGILGVISLITAFLLASAGAIVAIGLVLLFAFILKKLTIDASIYGRCDQ